MYSMGKSCTSAVFVSTTVSSTGFIGVVTVSPILRCGPRARAVGLQQPDTWAFECRRMDSRASRLKTVPGGQPIYLVRPDCPVTWRRCRAGGRP
jgi:hypothetical protein